MKYKIRLLLAGIFIVTLACQHDSPAENNRDGNCFDNDPIHEYRWLHDAVNLYTQPKSGETTVTVYRFAGDYYVAVENPSMNGPSAYIFNCYGKNIGELGITLNEFYDSAVKVKVLLHEVN